MARKAETPLMDEKSMARKTSHKTTNPLSGAGGKKSLARKTSHKTMKPLPGAGDFKVLTDYYARPFAK
jgi:hypothetical protein